MKYGQCLLSSMGNISTSDRAFVLAIPADIRLHVLVYATSVTIVSLTCKAFLSAFGYRLLTYHTDNFLKVDKTIDTRYTLICCDRLEVLERFIVF